MSEATPYEAATLAMGKAINDGLTPISWRLPCHMVPRFLMARDANGATIVAYAKQSPDMTLLGLPVDVVRPASPDAGLALICQGEAHG